MHKGLTLPKAPLLACGPLCPPMTFTAAASPRRRCRPGLVCAPAMKQWGCKTLPGSRCLSQRGYGAVKPQECQDRGWSRTGREGGGGGRQKPEEGAQLCVLGRHTLGSTHGCPGCLVLVLEAALGSDREAMRRVVGWARWRWAMWRGSGEDGGPQRCPRPQGRASPVAMAVTFRVGLVLNFIGVPPPPVTNAARLPRRR